jgi:hypothetical protein
LRKTTANNSTPEDMVQAMRENCESEATRESFKILARLIRLKFDAYLAEGFTREEALQLVLSSKS